MLTVLTEISTVVIASRGVANITDRPNFNFLSYIPNSLFFFEFWQTFHEVKVVEQTTSDVVVVWGD